MPGGIGRRGLNEAQGPVANMEGSSSAGSSSVAAPAKAEPLLVPAQATFMKMSPLLKWLVVRATGKCIP